MSIWSVPTFLDTLEDELRERDAFAGWEVFTAHPGGDAVKNKSLVIERVVGDQDDGTFGPNNDENYRAEGFIFRQVAGKGPQIWKQARDEAGEILADLGAYLEANPTVAGTVGYAKPGSFDYIQGANEKGRWCLIRFDIEVIALS